MEFLCLTSIKQLRYVSVLELKSIKSLVSSITKVII